MTITEIPIIDDYMRENKVDFSKALPPNYYFRTIQDIATYIHDTASIAVAGSIAGLACHNMVYNDKVLRNQDSSLIESDSQQWCKYVENAEWINMELDQFIDIYISQRRQVYLAKNMANKKNNNQEILNRKY